jgi:hypothetical protein
MGVFLGGFLWVCVKQVIGKNISKKFERLKMRDFENA